MIINFPAYAELCLDTIEKHGFEAWFVGGCVRDSILGREFYDIDITTNALPEQIEAIFEKTVPTGKKHGTITVIINSKPIEVTTYRSESGYSDNRHPECVKFESSIESDLSRRDFTINAFAYHRERGLLDLFNGVSDLESGIIRTVGVAHDRFNEDALRILRAYRFASVLGFELDTETERAAHSCGDLLANLSGERVLAELKKLSYGKNPHIIADFIKQGHLKPFGISDSDDNINKIVKINDEYKTAALITLCAHSIESVKSKLKPANRLVDQIVTMNLIKTLQIPQNGTELKLILNRLGEEYAEIYLEYAKVLYSEDDSKKLAEFAKDIFDNNEPFCLRHLKLDGSDLLKLGISGKDIKDILTKLTLIVIQTPKLNSKPDLMALVNKIM